MSPVKYKIFELSARAVLSYAKEQGYVAEKSDRGYLGGVECESRNREQDQGHPFHKTIFKLLRTNIMHHFTDILACKIS